jgi:hypothetical protein
MPMTALVFEARLWPTLPNEIKKTKLYNSTWNEVETLNLQVIAALHECFVSGCLQSI